MIAVYVDASVEAIDGKGSDGCYSLLGAWTPEGFCAELLKVLKQDGQWLSRGRDNIVPAQLSITIRKATDAEANQLEG